MEKSMQKSGRINEQQIWKLLTILLLAGFLFTGFLIFRDYGASSDEINQIEAGHIIWREICEKLGQSTPDFAGLPRLNDYYNRYYGQAATFPTVIIEALRGFTMDISSILRLRHIWNFLLYFCGLGCLGILTGLRFDRGDVVFFLLLFHILTPRLFGDAFYNDRDVLLISLLWIALLCFEIFCRKPGFFSAILCGFFFALAVNTRYFALILIFLPIMYLLQPERKKKGSVSVLIISGLLFFYILSPVLWGNFFKQVSSGFQLFSSGTQRTQETQGLAEILFFGEKLLENDLPFYYVPLWIFISTPVIPQLLAVFGVVRSIRQKKGLMDRFMLIFLCFGLTAVMLIRPVLYNGWRHMYFFYIPIFWFIGSGINCLMQNRQKLLRDPGIFVLAVSAILTAYRITTLHPYEYIYLNSFFQNREGDFDRDYWRLSTTDALEWVWSQEQDEFRISDTNANINNSMIGMFPWKRDRIILSQYDTLHRFPADYLLFNYSGLIEDTLDYPLFHSCRIIERDGVKLAEVFKRDQRFVPNVHSLKPDIPEITDGLINLELEWRSELPQNPHDEVVIEFDEKTKLHGLSLLPGNDEYEYARSPEISISTDGKTWNSIPAAVSDLFDLSFPEIETKWLLIRNTEESEYHWSIREIYFY